MTGLLQMNYIHAPELFIVFFFQSCQRQTTVSLVLTAANRKHFQKVRANRTNPPSPPSTKKALYLRPPGHHLLSSLRLSGAASLHSAVPEVTPAHDSRHADSLTAEEKTLSLGKNEDRKG